MLRRAFISLTSGRLGMTLYIAQFRFMECYQIHFKGISQGTHSSHELTAHVLPTAPVPFRLYNSLAHFLATKMHR
jgi:hypothetical protein